MVSEILSSFAAELRIFLKSVTEMPKNVAWQSKKSNDDLIVFRGIHNTITGNTIYQGIDNGFVSTSRSIKIAEKFAGKQGVIYEMRLDKDVSYLDLMIHNAIEAEILLPRGLNFTIISQKKVKKNIYVIMRVTNVVWKYFITKCF